jgi:hypothetical protein
MMKKSLILLLLASAALVMAGGVKSEVSESGDPGALKVEIHRCST